MKPCASHPVPIQFSRFRLLPTSALRAILKAQELLGLALGLSFLEFRENHGKLPERRRPHYTPRDRYRILELKDRNGWSAAEAARLFLLSPITVYGWLAEVNRDTETVGSLVRPEPPVQRFADAVRELVRTLDRLGFGSNLKIAQVLARVGYKLSARSVGRIRKELASPPTPIRTSSDVFPWKGATGAPS